MIELLARAREAHEAAAAARIEADRMRVEAIAAARASGLSNAAIAEALGMHAKSLSRVMRRAGVGRGRGRPPRPPK